MASERLVVIGKVLKPFGVKGELKVQLYTVTLEPFQRSDMLVVGEYRFTTQGIRTHKGAVLLSLEGVATPERARELVGCLVKTEERNLPPTGEDEYYWHELIGLSAFAVDGRTLGKITGLIETGANDVLQIEGEYGEILLPFIDHVIVEVKPDEGTILVDPLDGLVPDG
jgi:16S rRNA processing protein RimM